MKNSVEIRRLQSNSFKKRSPEDLIKSLFQIAMEQAEAIEDLEKKLKQAEKDKKDQDRKIMRINTDLQNIKKKA